MLKLKYISTIIIILLGLNLTSAQDSTTKIDTISTEKATNLEPDNQVYEIPFRHEFFVHLTNSFLMVMLFLSISCMVLFYKTEIKDYWYFSIFCFLLCIYYSNKTSYEIPLLESVLSQDIKQLINNSVQAFFYYFIGLFSYKFLEKDIREGFVGKALRVFIYFTFGSGVVMLLSYFPLNSLHQIVYIGFRLILLLAMPYLYFVLFKSDQSYIRLYAYGGFSMLILAGLAMYFSIVGKFIFGIAPLDFFTLGLIVFTACLAVSLGTKNQMYERDRLASKEALIEQLKRTQELEAEKKLQLADNLRLAQMNEKNSLLEKDMAELELQVLRGQLNPHFLYNSMNSLKLYILNNESNKAASFIDQFSSLFRTVLNNSRQRLVTLQEELDAMRKYLELEQIRFQNKFQFEINIDASIDATFVRIPPMIFQPFLENAIIHGISYLEDNQGRIKLDVQVDSNEGSYKVVIQDNGVGRKLTENTRKNRPKTHKSLGIQIIKERLEAIKKMYAEQAYFVIEDLNNEQNKPTGTKVSLVLPLDL